MLWLLLFTIALVFTTSAQRLKPPCQGLALALYVVGLFSGLWGFFIAPTLMQILLGLMAWGRVQLRSLQSNP